MSLRHDVKSSFVQGSSMLALDTECTGLSFTHGSRPFFIVTCNHHGNQKYWEWSVDPLTRMPIIPEGDLEEIGQHVFESGLIDTGDPETSGFIFHNSKFDFTALNSIGIWDSYSVYDVWKDVKDTLLGSHLLRSNQPKDLTSVWDYYTCKGDEMLQLEKRLEECVKKCRSIIQHQRLSLKRASEKRDADSPDAMVRGLDVEETERMIAEEYPLAGWRIASDDDNMLPGDKKEPWRADYWLPRAYAIHEGLPKDHEYYTVLRDYALQDPAATLGCWRLMKEELLHRGLMQIFEERMKVVPVSYRMEQTGVTMSGERQEELKGIYETEASECDSLCLGIAESLGVEVVLPSGTGINKSIKTFMFETLQLPVVGYTDSGAPSLDKNAMSEYMVTLKKGTKALTFIQSWQKKKKRETSIGFMKSYAKFWEVCDGYKGRDWCRIHSNMNIAGTHTLRFSCNNPNTQQISKQETQCEECNGDGCEECYGSGKSFRSLKYIFGPLPGREWFSFDAKNIEARLPAYISGEQELINLFEKPDLAPYYGSQHLLTFHTVYPEIWDVELKAHGIEKVGPVCKKKYASTYYGWSKNGNFAVQYGAVEKADGWGTADKAFHRQWAHKMLKERFSKLEVLNQECIRKANQVGYVETIPDRSLGQSRGYPIMCTRTARGAVLETVPLNYMIQSSAMWWTQKAMVRVSEFLESLNEGARFMGKTWSGGYHLVLQVHDELVVDMPSMSERTYHYNKPIAREVQRLMELGGMQDYGIPTPTGLEYHRDNWAEGISV